MNKRRRKKEHVHHHVCQCGECFAHDRREVFRRGEKHGLSRKEALVATHRCPKCGSLATKAFNGRNGRKAADDWYGSLRIEDPV